jgi:hypothetical protein
MLTSEPGLSAAEMQERIVAEFGNLPTGDLVELMAQAFALAELRGRASVTEGRNGCDRPRATAGREHIAQHEARFRKPEAPKATGKCLFCGEQQATTHN